MADVYKRQLVEGLKEGETGVFLETAHPAKFLETVESIISESVEIPAKLQEFMKGEKKSLPVSYTHLNPVRNYCIHIRFSLLPFYLLF